MSPDLISVVEYERMVELALVPLGRNIELIRGKIMHKFFHTAMHDHTLAHMGRSLVETLSDAGSIRNQSPLVLVDSVPDPDYVVCTSIELRGMPHPRASDTFIVIEVGDASVNYDRTTKLELYAENGLAEYWIVNLPDDCVEVYTQPDAANLRYAMRVIYSRTQSVPVTFGEQDFGALLVDSLLP